MATNDKQMQIGAVAVWKNIVKCQHSLVQVLLQKQANCPTEDDSQLACNLISSVSALSNILLCFSRLHPSELSKEAQFPTAYSGDPM